MTHLPRSIRGPLAVVALFALAVLVALPVLAASPSPSAGPGNGNGNGKGPKASHEPEVTVSVRGTVAAAADGEYTITVDGKTVRLEAGPPWFWGDRNPLKAAVGKSVTIVGEQSSEGIDVQSIDGKAIREPGKPPWAGGWKVVGKIHPGWSQDKADRMAAKQAAREKRQADRAACKAAGTCPSDDEPEASKAP